MPLTPEDVRNKQFTTVRLREGYDEDEVDAFLDEVEAELTRLLRENEDLRAKLAAATRAAAQNQQNMRKPPRASTDAPRAARTMPDQQQGGPQQGGPPQQGMPQQGIRSRACEVPALRCPPAYRARRSSRWVAPWVVRPSCRAVPRSCPPVPVAVRAARRVPARWARVPWVRARWVRARWAASTPMQQHGRPDGRPDGRPRPDGRSRWAAPVRAPVATAPPVSSRWPSRPPTRRSPRRVPRPTRSSARREPCRGPGAGRPCQGRRPGAGRAGEAPRRDGLPGVRPRHAGAQGRGPARLRARVPHAAEVVPGVASCVSWRPRPTTRSPRRAPRPPRLPAAVPGAVAWLRPAPSAPSYGGNHGACGGAAWAAAPAPSYGGQQQMSPAMTQPMAPVRPQGPSPMGRRRRRCAGFLIDEDDN